MKINIDALKILELKLTEYNKANGSIAEHESSNNKSCNGCAGTCQGCCTYDGCGGSCRGTAYNKIERNLT